MSEQGERARDECSPYTRIPALPPCTLYRHRTSRKQSTRGGRRPRRCVPAPRLRSARFRALHIASCSSGRRCAFAARPTSTLSCVMLLCAWTRRRDGGRLPCTQQLDGRQAVPRCVVLPVSRRTETVHTTAEDGRDAVGPGSMLKGLERRITVSVGPDLGE